MLVLKRFWWWAGADQVAVTVGVVDTTNRSPVLAPHAHSAGGSVEAFSEGIDSLLARVRVVPLSCD